MQGGLLHRSHSILMVLTPFYAELVSENFDFSGTTYHRDWNKCHWIWHASNPKCVPLTQAISTKWENLLFTSHLSKSMSKWRKFLKTWKFSLIFQEPLIIETSKPVPLDLVHALNPKNMYHSSHFDAFFPVKINKMWNFCLKFWFFRNHLS